MLLCYRIGLIVSPMNIYKQLSLKPFFGFLSRKCWSYQDVSHYLTIKNISVKVRALPFVADDVLV